MPLFPYPSLWSVVTPGMSHYLSLSNRLKQSTEDKLQEEGKRKGEEEGERWEIEREIAEEAIELKGFLGKSDKCQRRITMILTLTRTVETVLLWRDRRR